MKTTILNTLFAGLFMSAIVLTGCSKSEALSDLNNGPKQVTQMNPTTPFIDQDLGVILARDGGTDITAQFSDLTFNFNSTGAAHVWNDLLAQTGSWDSDQETGNFNMDFPTNIFNQLSFLNRSWMVGESSSAVVRLVAGDGDEVHFSPK